MSNWVEGPLDLSGLWSLFDLDRPELKFESFTGVILGPSFGACQ